MVIQIISYMVYIRGFYNSLYFEKVPDNNIYIVRISNVYYGLPRRTKPKPDLNNLGISNFLALVDLILSGSG